MLEKIIRFFMMSVIFASVLLLMAIEIVFFFALLGGDYNAGGAIVLLFGLLLFAVPLFFLIRGLRRSFKPKQLKNVVNNRPVSSTPETSVAVKQEVEQVVGYIEDGRNIYKTDHSAFTDEEVPYLVELGMRKALQEQQEHLQGLRNIFQDHVFNEYEARFFTALVEELKSNNLKPGLLQLTRLSSGTWNVDYVSVCYVGKIRLSKTPDKYAVIKKGRKRALRVLDSFSEAQEYMQSNSGDEIQVRPGTFNTYMHYFIGSGPLHELEGISTEKCIATIPRWIRYIKYCKRNTL